MITLRNLGTCISFNFSGNSMYLNDGEIKVPYNSLLLVSDSSDMATFKRIDGDIFISAKYEEFGMTKTQLENWFKNNACSDNSGGGGSGSGMTPGEVQTMIDDSISGKADTSAVTQAISAAVSGKADSSAVTQEISEAVSGKADTSALTTAIDGVYSDMLTRVDVTLIVDECIEGKADITAVTEDISEAVSGKADTSAVTEAISEAVSGKVDNSVYTAYTAVTDAAISGKVDNSTFTAYTAVTDAAIASKIGSGDVASLFGAVEYDSNSKRINFYHDSNSSTVLGYVDATDFIKDGMVNNVQIKNLVISGESVSCLVVSFNTDAGMEDINIPISDIFNANNYYTSLEVDAKLDAKADSSAVTQEISDAVIGKVSTSAIVTALTSGNTNSQVPSAKAVYDRFSEDEEVTARALIDLQENKAESSALTAVQDSLSGYVQTSHVTSAVTSGSTDVITSGGVYAQMGGLKLLKLTQAQYDALSGNTDSNTMYVIVG